MLTVPSLPPPMTAGWPCVTLRGGAKTKAAGPVSRAELCPIVPAEPASDGRTINDAPIAAPISSTTAAVAKTRFMTGVSSGLATRRRGLHAHVVEAGAAVGPGV